MKYNYQSKSVSEWMQGMAGGELALTDFQRSFVWKPRRIANFLKALLFQQHTGTILLVGSDANLDKRGIVDNDADISGAKDLILDGQQRLTSLWQALTGKGDSRFYIQVESLKGFDMTVENVSHYAEGFSAYKTPQGQFNGDAIPVSVLYDPPPDGKGSQSRLEKWCEEVIPNDSSDSGKLRRLIETRIKGPMERCPIWFAKFEGIDGDGAVRVFVETNSSSVKVSAFDLQVAEASQLGSGFKLRERIERLHGASDGLKHYFPQDREKFIPQIGDRILKTACLKMGESGDIPKDANFGRALKYLFATGTSNADKAEQNVADVFGFMERNGVPNDDMLPRIPPAYVIVALQDELEGLNDIDRAKAVRLLGAYLWQSFFSDRYALQANDRLHKDFLSLRRDLRRIKEGVPVKEDAPAFKSNSVDAAGLRQLPYKRSSPHCNAMLAMSVNNGAQDWVSGEALTVSYVRELSGHSPSQLDRHHVFPKSALVKGGMPKDDPRLNLALNIVLLRKNANIRLGGGDPAAYMRKLQRKNARLSKRALADRVESHLVPSYERIVDGNVPIIKRYEDFISDRAKLLADEIKRRAEGDM